MWCGGMSEKKYFEMAWSHGEKEARILWSVIWCKDRVKEYMHERDADTGEVYG